MGYLHMTNCNYVRGFILIELVVTLFFCISLTTTFSLFVSHSLDHQIKALRAASLLNKTASHLEQYLSQCTVYKKRVQDYNFSQGNYHFSLVASRSTTLDSFALLTIVGREGEESIELVTGVLEPAH